MRLLTEGNGSIGRRKGWGVNRFWEAGKLFYFLDSCRRYYSCFQKRRLSPEGQTKKKNTKKKKEKDVFCIGKK